MSTATELFRLVVHEITAYGQVTYKTLEQIENFLAAEPEAEPVAWRLRLPSKNVWHFQDDQEAVEALCLKGWIAEPLYTRPEPSRKPMTEEEIDEELETNEYYCAKSFADGVRFAEKHHGITK
jgi:hypothetical protein